MRTFLLALVVPLALTACGTTYQVPEAGESNTLQARKMFAEARTMPPRAPLSSAAAERRFNRVTARVRPVGQKFCQGLAAEQPNLNCDVDIAIDRDMKERNAYFTYLDGTPSIRISMPMLRDTASDDEAAFILSHEYGHLLGRHIEKQKQQAIAGAIIMGVIAGAIAADAGDFNSGLVNAGVGIGAAAGTFAYSQTYELESDTLGTHIAYGAGYDPVKGAQFFARPEDERTEAGKLSFWGTHPPDEQRLATVLATVDQIEANIGLQKVQ
jgi:Zn-dependent protease with chaperone function